MHEEQLGFEWGRSGEEVGGGWWATFATSLWDRVLFEHAALSMAEEFVLGCLLGCLLVVVVCV
jgi:hypothetical protein